MIMFSLRTESIIILIMWNIRCMLLDVERLYHNTIISLVECKQAVNIALWKNEADPLLS